MRLKERITRRVEDAVPGTVVHVTIEDRFLRDFLGGTFFGTEKRDLQSIKYLGEDLRESRSCEETGDGTKMLLRFRQNSPGAIERT